MHTGNKRIHNKSVCRCSEWPEPPDIPQVGSDPGALTLKMLKKDPDGKGRSTDPGWMEDPTLRLTATMSLSKLWKLVMDWEA